MEVKSISPKIFGAAHAKIEGSGNHTNPFGINFKGNIINADVFETTDTTNNISFKGAALAAKVGNRCKMLTSTIVGSIGDMSSAISGRLDTIMESARNVGRNIREGITNVTGKITEHMSGALNYLHGTKLAIDFGAENTLLGVRVRLKENHFNVKDLLRRDPESYIAPLLEKELALLGV